MRQDSTVAIARSGRLVALRDGDGLHVVDTHDGTRRTIALAAATFTWVGDELWIAARDGRAYRLARTEAAPRPIAQVRGARAIVGLGDAAIVTGEGGAWLVERDGRAREIEGGEIVAGFGRRAIAIDDRGGAALVALGKDLRLERTPLATRGAVRGAAILFGGRAIALWVRESAELDALLAIAPGGQLIHRIESPPLATCAFAEQAGMVIGHAGDALRLFDLRYGRAREAGIRVAGIAAIAVDELAKQVVVARTDDASISLLGVDELFAHAAVAASVIAPAPEPAAPPPAPDLEPPAPAFDTLAALAPIREPSPSLAQADLDRWIDAELEHIWSLGEERWRGLVDAGLRSRVEGAELDDLLAARPRTGLSTADRLALRAASPLGRLVAALGAGELAGDVLLAIAAPAIDPPIATLYRGLRARAVDATLLMQLFALRRTDRVRLLALLAPDAPLAHWGLVHVGDGPDPAQRALTSPDDLAPLLLDRAPAPASAAIGPVLPIGLEGELPAARELAALIDRDPAIAGCVWGPTGAGKRELAALVAHLLGARVHAWRAGDAASGAAIAQSLRRSARAALADGGLLHVALAPAPADDLARALALLDGYPGALVIGVTAAEPSALPARRRMHELVLPPLDDATRARIWEAALPEAPAPLRRAVARAFRLTRGEIADCADEIRLVAPERMAPRLRRAIERRLRSDLGEVATRREVTASWDDLVLPPGDLARVHEFLDRYRYADDVFGGWGFGRRTSYGHGLVALFSGEPGTGKTLLAGLVANKLDLALYQVDLGRVLSKWVGETEKQLDRLFDAAQRAHALLLFDECDSLFAKRTDGDSGGDHFANVAVNHLLQRLERYTGIAVLTTNKPAALDPALRRRLSLTLHIDAPDETERERLWRSLFPERAPIDRDVDFGRLATRAELTGGYIRNIALRAAFAARAAGRPIHMALVEHCIALELEDLGRVVTHAA